MPAAKDRSGGKTRKRLMKRMDLDVRLEPL